MIKILVHLLIRWSKSLSEVEFNNIRAEFESELQLDRVIKLSLRYLKTCSALIYLSLFESFVSSPLTMSRAHNGGWVESCAYMTKIKNLGNVNIRKFSQLSFAYKTHLEVDLTLHLSYSFYFACKIISTHFYIVLIFFTKLHWIITIY